MGGSGLYFLLLALFFLAAAGLFGVNSPGTSGGFSGLVQGLGLSGRLEQGLGGRLMHGAGLLDLPIGLWERGGGPGD